MGKKGSLAVVKNAEDRNAGRGDFITLKNENDFFLGYALFVPDGEASDNPGWLEYLEHYTKATGYCPCKGKDCPLCEDGDNPSTRAKTIWLVVKNEDDDISEGKLGIFALNYYMIQDFIDFKADDEMVKGQLFRIKRQAGNGKYAIRPKKQKLKVADVKKLLKDAPDLAELALKQQAKVLDELDLGEAMQEDDEAEEKENKKGAKGGDKKEGSKSKKGTPEPEADEEFDPDEADEFEGAVTITKINKSKNNVTVETEGEVEFTIYCYADGADGYDAIDATDFSKGDKIQVDADKDGDGDWVAKTMAEATDDESEGGNENEPDEIDGEECEVLGTGTDEDGDEIEDTLRIKLPSGVEMNLWFYEDGQDADEKDWSDIDLDDYTDKTVVVRATRDPEGDMTATHYPEVVKKGKKEGGKKSGKKSGKK